MAAPIRSEDSPQEKISKLLPADITAAFLSAKAGLIAGAGGERASSYIFWTFISILILSPAYFWYVTRARNVLQVLFLMLSFVVFAVSIADVQFTNYLQTAFPNLKSEQVIKVLAIVLPILWVFVISQIFVSALGDKVSEDAPARQAAKSKSKGGDKS
jgi:hypothetical protein